MYAGWMTMFNAIMDMGLCMHVCIFVTYSNKIVLNLNLNFKLRIQYYHKFTNRCDMYTIVFVIIYENIKLSSLIHVSFHECNTIFT